MAITEADIRFRASQRMTDFADGGGRMTSTVIVDGADNNVFDDIPDTDRLTGRLSLRKVFGGAFNNNTDVYLSAHAILDKRPDDSAVDSAIFADVSVTSERAAKITALSVKPLDESVSAPTATFTGGTADMLLDDANALFAVGDIAHINPSGSTINYVRTIIDIVGQLLTFDAVVPGSGSLTAAVRKLTWGAGPRLYGVGYSSAGASSGAAAITVDNLWSRIIPCDLALPYPGVDDPSWQAPPLVHYFYTNGQALCFREGDAVLIHHTAAMAPAAVANAQVVDTGRVTLQRLRVIGSDGTVHARFTRGQPAPVGVGCTADLNAGTVTMTDVSGFSQPVVIESRIEEMAAITDLRVKSGRIGLNRLLSRAYPAGTRVSSLLRFGDWQGRMTNVAFTQTAWLGSFLDTSSGGTPLADFNDAAYPFTCTNKGAITERWAFIFLTPTTFRCIGEQVGELAQGSTAAEYAPVNPATGAPYFTVPALGWGAGWAAGNVYRRNTAGANGAVWATRCTSPSAPNDDDDSVTLQLRGYNNV